MDNLHFYYNELKKQLEEIEMYIQSIELQRAMIRELESKREDLSGKLDETFRYSRIIKSVVASPIQYNAVIISIYGCFEQYIDNVFSNYCARLCEIVNNYQELPIKLQEKHVRKLGDFLSNPQRYRNYNLTTVGAIENAVTAFDNPEIGIAKNQKLVLSHSGNLKIGQISELANDLGINNFITSVAGHYLLRRYYTEQGDYSDETYTRVMSNDAKRLFDVLDQLVEERNNVAHGWVDNRLNFAEIEDKIIRYLKCLSEVISDVLLNSIVELECKYDRLICIGKPIKVIDHHIICINNGNVKLHKGEYLVAKKDGRIKVLVIETLEKNGQSVEDILDSNMDVGVGFQKRRDLNIDEKYDFFCNKSFVDNL